MKLANVDTLLMYTSALTCIVLLLMVLLKRMHQPYLIAYILTGIFIGPSFLGVFTDPHGIMVLGEIGILLHMFFMATEIEIPDSKSELAVPIAIQAVKMVLSAIAAFGIGRLLHWDWNASLCLWCILIFNSTAIASEYLSRTKGAGSALGKATLNVLVLQDLIFGPVLVAFQLLYQKPFNGCKVFMATIGLVLATLVIWIARKRRTIRIPYMKAAEGDHEIQVFLGLAICTVFAVMSSKIGLTASFGGFIAGILISRTGALSWLERMLRPYYVFFMCLFFLSIGLSIDLKYIMAHSKTTIILAFAIMLINSTLSMFAFRLLGYRWRESFYGGSLMSQIGEYSLLVSSVAYELGAIGQNFYKDIVCTSGLTILLSTIWITAMRAFVFHEPSFLRTRVQALARQVRRA